MTKDEAVFVRNSWIDTFSEMKLHMQPVRMNTYQQQYALENQYASYFEEDDDEDTDETDIESTERKKYQYEVTCINGFHRSYCSFNSACNAQFQAIVAAGAKVAMWNMYAAGYGPYMVNFVHDEVIYELPPKAVRQHIPRIEKLMIAGMKTVIPDVKVGVESSVMLHWDKKAVVEYNDLEYDKQGNPVLQEPPKVREIWKQACNSL